MKTIEALILLVLAGISSAFSQDTVTIDQKLTAAKTRHALVHDNRSAERARAFQAALPAVNADPEVAKLHAALAEATANLQLGKGDPKKISEISAALQKRQLAVLDALRPELKDYARARLAYRDELLKLRHEHKGQPKAKERLTEELKKL